MATRYSDPDQERLEKLRAYDAASGTKNAIAQERLALSQQKFIDDKERDARDFAFKSASEAAKAERAADAAIQRASHLQGVNEIQAQRLAQGDIAAKIAQAKADLEMERQTLKNKTDLDVLTQATGFLRDARGMDPTKPEFDRQYQELSAGYPMAFEHPGVKEWVSYHRPLREKFVAEGIAVRNKPADLVDKTVVLDENGAVKSTTTKQSLPAGAALQAEHDALEAAVNAKSGKKQDPAEIARLNSLKSKLGYALVGDAASTAATTAAPLATPTPTTVAPAPVVRTATNPTTGQKMAFIDGKWQPQN